MTDADKAPDRARWARLRFSIVGPLLTCPPESGELATRITELSQKPWQHPNTGETVRFSFKTIERWFYIARQEKNPFAALERKVPAHAGTHPSMSPAVEQAIRAQYAAHPRWSYQLHHDNLVAQSKEKAELIPMPGYATVCRYMKHHGLLRQKRRRHKPREGEPFDAREQRSFEVEHVMALWHLDFHEGRRKVLTASGEWKVPFLLGVLDDRSRLSCHLQWYLDETTESLVHGFCQGLQKRRLPRAVLSDNGAAMLAAEFREGLERLGILHHTTLAYSPEQNAKQEVFWAQVEGRLMAMLEGQADLSLAMLNEATSAWVELEYNRKEHQETHQAPLDRHLQDKSVARDCPDSDALRRAFRAEVRRKQRRSDGTITVEGVRFELPSAYRSLIEPTVRVARWDLSTVELVDPRTGAHLSSLLPLDKAKNADRRRRALDPGRDPLAYRNAGAGGVAPLLRQLMADYAATGLPPGFLPQDPTHDDQENEP